MLDNNIKALIVILTLSLPVLHFAKPIMLRFGSEADFIRRRKVWVFLTVVGLLSPSFWLFAVIAIPVLLSSAHKDSNPVALYLMLLHVIPPVPLYIPVPGIGQLFEADIYRLLALCVLLPASIRLRKSTDPQRIRGLQSTDVLLLGFGLLQTMYFIPPDLPSHVVLADSPTNLIRRGFLFWLDVYLLYFVVSRTCSTRRTIVEALAAFCLGCALLAPIAVFESIRHWLLYIDINSRWGGDPGANMYLMRGGLLRAQVSAGHSLALGYLLAIAFGFWLYLQSYVESKRTRLAVTLLFWLGLLAAYSRGPWLGAAAIYLTYAALGPRPISRLLRSLVMAACAGAIVLATPIGQRIVSVLPFMGGSVDMSNVIYRQRLAERSWDLIQQHPWLGDQYALFKMGDLRQGQGIIDLVNTYVNVTLFYGFIGLFLFGGFMLSTFGKALWIAKRSGRLDPDFSRLGISMTASIVGALLMLASMSFILGCQKMYYVLAALAAAYAHMGRSRAALPVQAQLSTTTGLRGQ